MLSMNSSVSALDRRRWKAAVSRSLATARARLRNDPQPGWRHLPDTAIYGPFWGLGTALDLAVRAYTSPPRKLYEKSRICRDDKR